MNSVGIRPYLWMLSGSLAFTVMAELAQVLTHGGRLGSVSFEAWCDWPTAAIARSLLAAVFAAGLVVLTGAKFVFLRPWRLWVRSVAGSCSMVCTFYAFATLPTSSDVLTLTNTFPLWVALLCWPLYGQPPDWKVWLAIGAGVVGVALIEQPHLEAGHLGALAALAAAGFTAVAMLGLHSLSAIDPRAVVVHFSGVATAFCVAAFFMAPRAVPLEPASGFWPLALLLGLGLSATIGQVFLTLAFGSGAPAKVSVVGLTQIVFALVFDFVLWDHQINALALLGTALVIAPTAWVLTRSAQSPEAVAKDHSLEDTKESAVPASLTPAPHDDRMETSASLRP